MAATKTTGPFPGRYAAMTDAIRRVRADRKPGAPAPIRLVMIGVYDGARFAAWVAAARRAGFRAIEATGFDLFEDMTPEKNAKEVGKPGLAPGRAAAEAKIRGETGVAPVLVKGDTAVTLPAWAATNPPAPDVVLVDGGHSLESIASDWAAVSRVAGPNTIVLFDDYYPDREDAGCKPLIDALARDPAWRVEVLGPQDHYPHTGVTVRFARVTRSPSGTA